MDAKRLSETKALLKRRSSLDRSKPMVEDAAHPGSAGMLRQISAGHFDLKHHTVEHDASKPMLEAGTGVHTDVRPAVFAEGAQSGRRASPGRRDQRTLGARDREVGAHRRHVEAARKSVIEELKEKKSTIDAMHQYNEHPRRRRSRRTRARTSARRSSRRRASSRSRAPTSRRTRSSRCRRWCTRIPASTRSTRSGT